MKINKKKLIFVGIGILLIGVIIFLVSLGLTGKKAAPMDVNIKYIGNSCFYMTFSDGTTIVTDPGSRFETYFAPFPSIEADVITISHSHPDHIGGIILVGGDPKVLYIKDMKTPFTIGKVTITGFLSNHVDNLGENMIYLYEYNNLKIVHIGETDTVEDEGALKAIQDADVVFMYAGELGDVPNSELYKFLKEKNVKVIIPQHYSMKPDRLFYGQPTIDTILSELPEDINVKRLDEINISKGMDKQFVVLSGMGEN